MLRMTRCSSRRGLKPQTQSQSKLSASISQTRQYQKLSQRESVSNKSENKKSQIKDNTLKNKRTEQKADKRLQSVEKQNQKFERLSANCVSEGLEITREERYVSQIVKYLCGGQKVKDQWCQQCGESRQEKNGERQRVYRSKLRRRLIRNKRMEKEHNGKRCGDQKESRNKTKRVYKDYQMKEQKAKEKRIISRQHKKLRSVGQKIQQIINLCCPNANEDVNRDHIKNFTTIKAIQGIVNQVIRQINNKKQTEDKEQVNETIESPTNTQQPMSKYYKYLRQQYVPLFVKLAQISMQPQYSKKLKQIFQQDKNHSTTAKTNKSTFSQIKRQKYAHPQQVVREKQQFKQMGILRSDIYTDKMESQSFLLDVLGNFEPVRFANHDWMQELQD